MVASTTADEWRCCSSEHFLLFDLLGQFPELAGNSIALTLEKNTMEQFQDRESAQKRIGIKHQMKSQIDSCT